MDVGVTPHHIATVTGSQRDNVEAQARMHVMCSPLRPLGYRVGMSLCVLSIPWEDRQPAGLEPLRMLRSDSDVVSTSLRAVSLSTGIEYGTAVLRFPQRGICDAHSRWSNRRKT